MNRYAPSARITEFSLAHASGNTMTSAVPWKSSSVRRAYSAPDFLEICRFTMLTTAAILTFPSLHMPSVAVERLLKTSTSVRNLARGWPEMKNPSTAFSRARRILAEQGVLSRRALLLPHLCFAERMIQGRDQLRALASEGITRPGVDQRLDDALVAQPQIDAVAQLDQCAVRCRLPSRDDGGDRALPDIAHRTQPEPDPPIPDDRELVAGLVHVGCEDLQVELASLVDVLHDAIGVADFRRQQRRHELGRIIRLEPRRLVRQDRVGDGV